MTINADRPIQDPGEDRYGVSGDFLDALHAVSRQWPGSEGVVVGLYGEWGIGKTSALNLLRARLKDDEREIVVTFDWAEEGTKKKWFSPDKEQRIRATLCASFSPWFYRSTEALIGSFFGSVAAAIAESGGSALGQRMRAMGRFLAHAGSAVTVGGVAVDFNSLLDGGEATLHRERAKIEGVLRSFGAAGGRLVVLVDDVDRLDRGEILDLFRVLRIAGDLPAISVVVAMDYARVAAILDRAQEHGYGSSYLEKIIQVDLHLPQPQRNALSAQTTEVLESAFLAAKVSYPSDLRPGQWGIVKSAFDLILDEIATPRDVARYGNAIRALMVAAGSRDLNPTDAAVVEAIHVFHPGLYRALKSHRKFFTERNWVAPFAPAKEKAQGERELLYEEILRVEGDSREVRGRAEALLARLFGDLKSAKSQKSADEINKEAQQRRVSSSDFFDHYFLVKPEVELPTRSEVSAFVASVGSIAANPDGDWGAEIASAFAGRSAAYVERFGIDLQFALDELNVPQLRELGLVLINQVLAEAPDTGSRLSAAVLLSLGHYRGDSSWEDSRASVRELALEAANKLPANLALDFLEAARIYRVIDEEAWKDAACLCLERAIEALSKGAPPFDGSVADLAFGRLIAEIRIAAGRASGLGCAVSREVISKHIVEYVTARPTRLPELLVCISVSSGDDYSLNSRFEGQKELTERVLDLFGTSAAAQAAVDAFYAAAAPDADARGLVGELAEILKEGTAE